MNRLFCNLHIQLRLLGSLCSTYTDTVKVSMSKLELPMDCNAISGILRFDKSKKNLIATTKQQCIYPCAHPFAEALHPLQQHRRSSPAPACTLHFCPNDRSHGSLDQKGTLPPKRNMKICPGKVGTRPTTGAWVYMCSQIVGRYQQYLVCCCTPSTRRCHVIRIRTC